MRWWSLAVLAALLLSGCNHPPCIPGPLVTARGITPDTPREGGPGPFELIVQVQDPAGRPIPGAGVVLYWSDANPAQYREELQRPEAGVAGRAVEPGSSAGTPQAQSVIRLAADAQGEAVARLPASHAVGLVAAADGFTEEWVGYVATLASGSARQAVTLYPARLEWTWNGTWGPAAASAGALFGSYAWQPTVLEFEGEAAPHLARMVRLQATVRWQNMPPAVGDLAVGLGPPGNLRAVGDAGINPAGPQEEMRSLGAGELHEYGFHADAELAVGPATGSALVAPLGLEYSVHVVAELNRAKADFNNCLYVVKGKAVTRDDSPEGGVTLGGGQPSPGAAGAWILAGLLACAWLRRRGLP